MSLPTLVVDPGKTTGWGLFSPAGPTFQGGELPHFEFLQHADWLIRTQSVSAVVCESFVISQRTTKERADRMYSLEQIGVLRYLCHVLGVPYIEQSPGEAKAFATDAKLKALNWYATAEKGERGHRRDAARHAILYGIRNNLIDPRRFL